MAKIKSLTGRFECLLALWLLIICAICAPNLWARDAFVMLSGGDSPMANNYSQYLQAKALTAYFDQHYPRDSVWIFFGAGNVEGEKPVFGDVLHQVKRDGMILDTWVPGSLPRNLPSRRGVILRTFREEILPAVADGGTLFLFVGDHGSRTPKTDSESLIDLWGLHRDPASEHGWSYDDNESLGVAELRRTLNQGIGKGRVVFCMTQCHGGGFHYLAIPHEMTPNPKWFNKVPEWAARKEQPAFPRAAGFTATDEYSLASGCDPSPDPDEWAGYERFLPEYLLGMDLFTLRQTHKGFSSFAEAHIAATLVDRTIDKPYSTSEQYLERWANLIETKMMKDPNLTSKTKNYLAAYQRTIDGAMPKISDPAFRERETLFLAFITRLTQENAAVKDLLLTGTCRQLQETIKPPRSQNQGRGQQQPPRQGRRGGGRGGSPEMQKLWKETVRPAWKEALEANEVTNMAPAAVEFEKYLLGQEEKGRNFFFPGGARELADEVYWHSGYSDPQTLNVAKAEAVVRWGSERRAKILAWAKDSEDEDVQNAADKLIKSRPQRRTNFDVSNQSDFSNQPVSEKTAAERTLFYRRVLAAWEFLIATKERPALARLRELTDLERTPLPLPK
ncbi:MAG: hypothetical protein JWR26_2090 [Pedosphaera sp.]|nr:hypothetical protein [Pedosphaera sp.]